jgi:hypothetical protein
VLWGNFNDGNFPTRTTDHHHSVTEVPREAETKTRPLVLVPRPPCNGLFRHITSGAPPTLSSLVMASFSGMPICIPYLDPRRMTGGFTTEKGGNVMSALGRVMFPNVRAGGSRFPSVFCVYICTILNPGRRQPKHLWGLALCLCACLHFPLL